MFIMKVSTLTIIHEKLWHKVICTGAKYNKKTV